MSTKSRSEGHQRGCSDRKGPQAIIVGSLTRERIEIGGRVLQGIGGVVWHAGTTLADLGVRTGVVTRIATADEDLVAALQAAGVEVTWHTSTQTTTFLNRYAADELDKRTQFVMALAEPIQPVELIKALGNADLAFLGPLHPEDLADDIASVFGYRRPLIVAIDVQGYTRLIRDGAIMAGLDHRLPDILAVCDVIKASQDEAQLITGSPDAEEGALKLARSCPGREILVTCGARGMFAAYEGKIHHEPAVPADIVEPTGAGDIFFAAYLAKRLENAPVGAAAAFAANFTARRLTRSDASPLVGN